MNLYYQRTLQLSRFLQKQLKSRKTLKKLPVARCHSFNSPLRLPIRRVQREYQYVAALVVREKNLHNARDTCYYINIKQYFACFRHAIKGCTAVADICPYWGWPQTILADYFFSILFIQIVLSKTTTINSIYNGFTVTSPPWPIKT